MADLKPTPWPYKRLKNPHVVYTGQVGARMKMPAHRLRKKPMQYAKVVCVDGPLHGRSLSLELNTGNHTLPFVLHGQAGQYRAGRWVPDPQAERRKAESLGYPTTVEPDADIPL